MFPNTGTNRTISFMKYRPLNTTVTYANLKGFVNDGNESLIGGVLSNEKTVVVPI